MNDTRKLFNAIVRAHPDLMKGVRYLDRSGPTIIAETDTDVLKIFSPLAHPGPTATLAHAENEANLYRILRGRKIGGIQVPRMKGDLIYLYSDAALCAIRMSKIYGRRRHWGNIEDMPHDESAIEFMRGAETHFYSVGVAMAKFHRAVADVPKNALPDILPEHRYADCKTISQLEWLEPEWNAALRCANRYLAEHALGGIIQGDFDASNLRCNAAYQVTGIFDFEESYYAPNQYLDFLSIPFMARPYAMKGYDTIKPVDYDVMLLTEMAELVSLLKDPGITDTAVYLERVAQQLASIAHITGFKPPAGKLSL